MDTLTLALAASIGAGAAVTVVLIVCKRPMLGMGLVLVSFVSDAVWGLYRHILTIGPFNVALMDIVAILLMASAGVRALAQWRQVQIRPLHRVLMVFGFLLVVSLLRGVASYGIETSVNEFRSYLYLLAILAFTAGIPWTEGAWRAIARGWEISAIGLGVVALARWAIVGMGGPASHLWLSAGGTSTLRVLNASEALFLSQAVLLMWAPDSQKPRRTARSLLGFSLLAMIAVLQHRTVWVVAAVYLGLTALRKGAYRRHAIVSLGLMVLLGSVIGLGLLGENLRDSMLTSVEEPFRSNASTIAWRVEGWRMLLGGQDRLNVLDFIVGAPLGTRFLRLVFGSWVDVTPHNYYLQTYLRVGLVGLASLLVMYGTMIASLQRAGRQLATKDDAFWLLSVLLVGQLVFFVTYGPNYEQGILLGAALAMCVRMPRRDIRTSREGSESWLPAPSSPS